MEYGSVMPEIVGMLFSRRQSCGAGRLQGHVVSAQRGKRSGAALGAIRFSRVERQIAKRWRKMIKQIDLQAMSGTVCRAI